MKTAMISTGNKVAGTTNNSEICPPLILEMATFQFEVIKSIDVIFFFFPFQVHRLPYFYTPIFADPWAPNEDNGMRR